jgi:hypothetical protein
MSLQTNNNKYEFEKVEIDESSKYQKYNPISDEKPREQMKPLDLDLMVFLAQREKERNTLTRELIIIYIPFLIFVTMYMFFGYEITSGFWMHEALKVRTTPSNVQPLECKFRSRITNWSRFRQLDF